MQACKLKSILGIVVVIVCTASHCYGQADSLKKECYKKFSQLREVYYLGNSLKLDSLYQEFINSDCKKIDTTSYLEVLRIMADQRHKDGYIAEKQKIRKELDYINYKRLSQTKATYTYKYLAAEGFTGRRVSSDLLYGYGVKGGWISKAGLGLDVTARIQNMNSSITYVDNRDSNGLFKPDGIYFQSSATSKIFTTSAAATITFLDRGYQSKWVTGLGLSAGLEAVIVNSTTVKSFYYESNYVDSIIGPSQHRLTFTAATTPDPDRRFYTPRATARAIFGVHDHFVSNKFLISVSVQYSTATFDRFQATGYYKDVYARSDYVILSVAVGVGSLRNVH